MVTGQKSYCSYPLTQTHRLARAAARKAGPKEWRRCRLTNDAFDDMKIIDGIPVWGTPQPNAVEQMKNAMRTAHKGALMADHHLGYAVPVGGVIAYQGQISPSGVGYDIACGNKAVLTNLHLDDVDEYMGPIMDSIMSTISFGVGQKNNITVDHELFDDDAWDFLHDEKLKDKARAQLGTVGSGNHYVDVFHDELKRIWVGVHFGSRGLGHTIATKYIHLGGGKDGINVDPVVLDIGTSIGDDYVACMNLAGRYAYAGRDWVCSKVVELMDGKIIDEVHNHHNFAWLENHEGQDLWVVRKGATPALPGQRGFVGGTMGENSVILEGKDNNIDVCFSMYSTVHGAGRVMSRTEAAGKFKWKHGQRIRKSEGKISPQAMKEWVIDKANVELRGGGCDEAPQAYKRLDEVLAAHSESIKILHTLTPIGVAMAGENEFDPYKD